MGFPRNQQILAVAAFGLAAACPVFAGLGNDFGTRDPIACPVRSAPRAGAPTLQQAMRYFACDTERIGDMGQNIYLLGDSMIQITPKGRSYDAKNDPGTDVDATQPVYELHGDFRLYQCGRKSSVAWQINPGHACRFQEFFAASGICWKDSRSDWHCAMAYSFEIQHTVHDAVPPQ